MDHFFDEAARILASDGSRRQSLKRLGALLAGGLLASLGARPARAQNAVCTPACKGQQKCCPGVNRSFCTAQTMTCCGATACNPNQVCCPGNGVPFCRNQNETCCGSKACKNNEVCCPASNTCCKQCTPSGHCSASPN